MTTFLNKHKSPPPSRNSYIQTPQPVQEILIFDLFLTKKGCKGVRIRKLQFKMSDRLDMVVELRVQCIVETFLGFT